MLQVVRHRGHATAAELTLDQVAIIKGFAECEGHTGHGTDHGGRSPESANMPT
jgi:hypothetical protein